MMQRVWPRRTTPPQWASAGMTRSSAIAPSAVMASVSSPRAPCGPRRQRLVRPHSIEAQPIEPVPHLHPPEQLVCGLEMRARAGQITEAAHEPPEREVTARGQRSHAELLREGERLGKVLTCHL